MVFIGDEVWVTATTSVHSPRAIVTRETLRYRWRMLEKYRAVKYK